MSELKFGDKVKMNSKYYVSEQNKDKEFVVRSAPWVTCGTECVLLEGKSGGYATDGLDKIKEVL